MKTAYDTAYLPENTHKVFTGLLHQKFISDYTLVGGTALSIQIRHRLSEDLDFVFDGEELDIHSIKRNIKRIFPDHRIIRQDYKWQIDFIIYGI